MQPAAFAARLTSTLALLAACHADKDAEPGDTDTDVPPVTDTDTDADTGRDWTDENAALLAQCAADPLPWTPEERHQHLVLAHDCVPVPTDADCPDPSLPLPWPGLPPLGRFCATATTVCAVELLERREEVLDSGIAFDTDDQYDACCYSYVGLTPDYVCGRPFRVADAVTTAPPVAREGWRSALAVQVPADPDDRRAAADRWLADARTEHASIAAFARLALDLLAHGAPAALVAQVTAAMADEVRHAADAFAIASALAGRPLGPGPLPVDAASTPSLVELAVATARDGGIGEALAAGIAAARLSVTTDPAVRAVLAGVVEDEARHAVLAWEIVAWAIEVGGDAVSAAVDAEVRRLADEDAVVGAERRVPSVGLCGDDGVRAAVGRVWAEVLAPCGAC